MHNQSLKNLLDGERKEVKSSSIIPWEYSKVNMFVYNVEYENGEKEELWVDRHYPEACSCPYKNKQQALVFYKDTFGYDLQN